MDELRKKSGYRWPRQKSLEKFRKTIRQRPED
jgi:hypothetical protein